LYRLYISSIVLELKKFPILKHIRSWVSDEGCSAWPCKCGVASELDWGRDWENSEDTDGKSPVAMSRTEPVGPLRGE
jgi:hypothetical protein